MTKMQVFLLSLSMTSASYASWSFQEKPYEMDQNKDACTVSTQTEHNNLEFSFPKDKVGFPLIKMTNKFDREYIASRLYLENSRVRFFGKDDSGQSEFYMIPQSANELETFLGVVKRNSKLKIEKLYIKNRAITPSTGDFSLSGSSKVLNQLKDCLSGSYLSSSQEQLISSIAQRSFLDNGQSVSSNYRENMNLGLKIYSGIQSWDSNNLAYEKAQEEVEAKQRDAGFIELKEQKDTIDTAILKTNKNLSIISSNEKFYENSDRIISELESNQVASQSSQESFKSEVNNLVAEIERHQIQINSLNLIVADESQASRLAQGDVEVLNTQIVNLREEISRLSRSTAQSSSRQSIFRSQSITFERAMTDAKHRSDNSRQIKRETEESLYRQFGGKPFEIELEVESLANEFKQVSATAARASHYVDLLDEVVDLAGKAKAFNPDITRVQNELNCFKNSQGAAIKNCLTRSMNEINQRINQMIAERREHESDRCRFPIGRSRCKRKRDERIAAVNARIAVVEIEKNVLVERIKVIETTGEDPRQAQTISALTTKVNDLRSKRKQAIEVAQRKINQIVDRDIRVFSALDRVKKCVVSVNEFCDKIAGTASARLQQTFQHESDRADQLKASRESRLLALRNLKNAIRTQVDGIETRLFEEYRTARLSYEENALALDREIDAQRATNSQLAKAQNNLGSLNVRLGGAQENARQASRRLAEATQGVSNYERRVGFDSLIGSLSQKRGQLEDVELQVAKVDTDLENARERKIRVEREINNYPAQRDQLSDDLAQQQRELNEVLPRFQVHQDELSALTIVANTERTKNVEAQELVRSSIGLIRNKY